MIPTLKCTPREHNALFFSFPSLHVHPHVTLFPLLSLHLYTCTPRPCNLLYSGIDFLLSKVVVFLLSLSTVVSWVSRWLAPSVEFSGCIHIYMYMTSYILTYLSICTVDFEYLPNELILNCGILQNPFLLWVYFHDPSLKRFFFSFVQYAPYCFMFMAHVIWIKPRWSHVQIEHCTSILFYAEWGTAHLLSSRVMLWHLKHNGS